MRNTIKPVFGRKKGSSNTTAIVIIVLIIIGVATGIYMAKKKSDPTSTTSSNTKNTSNGQVAGTDTSKREVISTPGAEIIIFYGSTCPHCKDLNDYIVAKELDKLVPLQHLEVYKNNSNKELMWQKLEQCKDISANDKGSVPFMYAPDKCLIGSTPIEDYLKNKVN